MLHDMFQLYLTGIVTMVFSQIRIIEDRDKEERQNCGSGESPDDRPSKTGPDWISGDDERPGDCGDRGEHDRDEPLLRPLDNGKIKTLSVGYKLVDIIQEDDGIPDDDAAERDRADHGRCREIGSGYQIENGESGKYSEEREKECRHNDSPDKETPKLCNDQEVYSEKREYHRKSEITEGVHRQFPFPAPFQPILLPILRPDEVDPIGTGTYLLVPHYLELLVSEETIEFQDRVHNRVISEFRIDMSGFCTVVRIYLTTTRPKIHLCNVIQTDFFPF